MGFGSRKYMFLLVFLLAVSDGTRVVKAGRPFSILKQKEGYSKIFAAMGIECKCCDGVGGNCTSVWTDSCSSVQCSPWKQF